MSEHDQSPTTDERPEPPGWPIMEGDAEPGLCERCGRPIQPDGRSASSPGEDGRPVLHSIRLTEADPTASAN